jgi:hypothetical protein
VCCAPRFASILSEPWRRTPSPGFVRKKVPRAKDSMPNLG